jgi:dihydrofolate reductase
MRVVLIDFMSLDGVIQAPGGPEEDPDGGFQHGGWSHRYFDPEVMGAYVDEALRASDALLFGRRTWQGMAAAWPGRAGDPFADRMNAVTKYVASRTLSEADLTTWNNSHLLPPDDAVGAVAKLKTQDGGNIQVWGSATLAQDLITNDLVDDLDLLIEPVVLGGGKRLFPEDGALRDFEFVSATTAKTGVQICKYKKAAT